MEKPSDTPWISSDCQNARFDDGRVKSINDIARERREVREPVTAPQRNGDSLAILSLTNPPTKLEISNAVDAK